MEAKTMNRFTIQARDFGAPLAVGKGNAHLRLDDDRKYQRAVFEVHITPVLGPCSALPLRQRGLFAVEDFREGVGEEQGKG